MKKPYHVNSPNQTAVNLLRSWLNSCNIPNQVDSDFDIVINGLTDVFVKVCKNPQEYRKNAVNVLSSDITGKNLKTALAAFNRVIKAAGYEKQNPLDRGPEPSLNARGNPIKLHYKKEDFLVAIRHTEFRRSPNPPDNRWNRYKRTIDAVCNSFYCLKRKMCDIHGLTKDDLLQYARCLTVNFCARYEISNPIYCDNERKLYEYLRQRFHYDLFRILKKKESNLFDIEVAKIARFADPSKDLVSTPFEEESKPKKRSLDKLLNKLPHNQIISVLSNASKDEDLDSETRHEAKKRLEKHVKSCSECGA